MRHAALVGVVVIVLSQVAAGQTFVRYALSFANLSDPRDIPRAGDTVRVSVRVVHDGLSYAAGKIDISVSNSDPADFTIAEDAFRLPFDPWEIGRTPLTRIAGSDGPADSVQPRDDDVVASTGGYGVFISDIVGDDLKPGSTQSGFDFATVPPALGGLAGVFPIASGDELFNFDYIYNGRRQVVTVNGNERARLWQDGNDLRSVEVSAESVSVVVMPAPMSISLLGVALLAGMRRRAAA